MANHVQLVYDGTNLKKIGGAMFELADKAFYNGKYYNAIGRYNTGLKYLPDKKGTGVSGLTREFSAQSAALTVDVNALDAETVRAYTGVLNTLGIYYQSLGRYKKAELFLSLSMKIREEEYGKSSPAWINSLHNMAVLKKDLGAYAETEYIFNYLGRVIPKLFTEESYHYATYLNNKAMLDANLGRLDQALSGLDEAQRIGKLYFDSAYIDYERVLINKGFLLLELGRTDEAITVFNESAAGFIAKGFENHPDHNDLLIYLGKLYLETNPSYAKSFIDQSVSGAKKRYGTNHLVYAKALTNLGLYNMLVNDYVAAKKNFEVVKGIQLNALGAKHRDYINTLVYIGVCDWYLNNTLLAHQSLQEAINGYIFILDTFFPALSESEKGEFWSTMKPNIDVYLDFVASNFQSNPEFTIPAYNALLRTKGVLVNATTNTKDQILASGDEALIAQFVEWTDLKDQIAYYYTVPKEQAKEDKVDLIQLEAMANELEKSLSRQSAKFNKNIDTSIDYFSSVKSALGEAEGALEIARVQSYIGPHKDQTAYVGFVVKPGQTHPGIVVVPEGEELENRQLKYYRTAMKFQRKDELSFDKYWGPMTNALEGVDHLYMAVDGVYNNINILSLHNGTSYLVDKRLWTMLSNTRFIPQIKSNPTMSLSNGQYAFLLGNPDFGDKNLIAPLPGTGVEIDYINTLLIDTGYDVEKYTEMDATEENLKSVHAPAILHVATHGFFLSDISKNEGMIMGVQVIKAKNNPLLRSGLMLTDASTVFSDESQVGVVSNGILNAYEAMNLNLENTDLVILSACETGTGEIVNGEGVYGLPRAFQVAGAANVIMSLWKVDDGATQELMENFYQNWTGGETLDQSLHLAQLKLREKYEHPYYWGAFVLIEN
jgi:CHAT domain-containing protein